MQCKEIEVQLSGYLDDELTQQQKQYLELHIEECASCEALLNELKELKNKTRQITYMNPSDKEWQRMERHIFQDISRGLGWVILIVWSTVTAGYGAYQFAITPNEPFLEKILVFGFFLGLALIFLSVLSERMRDSKNDPYKGVQK